MNESNTQKEQLDRDLIDKFVLLGVLFLITFLFPFLGLVLGIALIWVGLTSRRSKDGIMNRIAMVAIFVGVIVILMWILLLLGLMAFSTSSTITHSEKTAPTACTQEVSAGGDTNQTGERSALFTVQSLWIHIVGRGCGCYFQRVDWSYNSSAI